MNERAHISVSPEDLLLSVESVACFVHHYYLLLVVFEKRIMRSCLIQPSDFFEYPKFINGFWRSNTLALLFLRRVLL